MATSEMRMEFQLEAPPPNTSGLHPGGWAVLCEPYETSLKADKIHIPESVQASTAVVDQKMRVVEIGPEAWKSEREPRAVPGDVVLVTKYAGHVAIGRDGKPYRLVNANDIFCRCEE